MNALSVHYGCLWVYLQVRVQFLLAPGDRRRRQLDADSQRLDNGQHFADLAGFLALFEFDDEAQAGARGQRQIFLRDAQPLPTLPDNLADIHCCVFQWLTAIIPVRE